MKERKKKKYTKPTAEEVMIESTRMFAGSFTGTARDSDDSDFGDYEAPAQRRGTWGNLWSE